ncbi:MAG: NUDIX hydrolase [Flavobacteriales bacterium AspAUS03]
MIVRHENKILLTTRKKNPDQNSWYLPGGFIKP